MQAKNKLQIEQTFVLNVFNPQYSDHIRIDLAHGFDLLEKPTDEPDGPG